MALVTGPNMAGKSTILRQIGLCVVLAQMGSFVPAAEASIGTVDRLFTRVGASDNLARGQSTFMVEMSETSAILHNAGRRSLVLLDEIGRGTSTYDGVAIAWAVTEHLHDRVGCKTMFATHYHELMQLPERLQHARNYNVAVRETGDTVVFLHRLEPGGTDRSYGIHVAQLAGLPDGVVRRAREILGTLEGEHRMVPGAARGRPRPRASSRCSPSAAAARPHGRGAAPDRRQCAHAARGAQPAGGVPAARGGPAVSRRSRPAMARPRAGLALACGREDDGTFRISTSTPVPRPATPTSRPSRSIRCRPVRVSRCRCWSRGSRAGCCSGCTPIRWARWCPDSTRVAESSGYPALDSAALAGRAGAPLLAGAPARPARRRRRSCSRFISGIPRSQSAP